MVATFLLPLALLSSFSLSALAENDNKDASPTTTVQEENGSAPSVEPVKDSLSLNCKSAILMEANTGTVLYEQNPDEALPPASVTKIMTLLLVMEAVDEGRIKLTDTVTASERAASMQTTPRAIPPPSARERIRVWRSVRIPIFSNCIGVKSASAANSRMERNSISRA